MNNPKSPSANPAQTGKTSLRLYSWNVNGLRAVLNKGALQKLIEDEHPDILCLQEIKARPDQVLIDLPDYTEFWQPATRAGYSGTAIFVHKSLSAKTVELEKTQFNDNYGDVNDEGRLLVLEFPKFFLVNVYTPNAKPDLSRLQLRQDYWDPEFMKLLQKLEQQKPVIACGDFNAAHEEIDLARPKANRRSAGFTDEERQGITNLITAGFIDTFRAKHPNAARYTWWSHWGQARTNNVGWRIDYFFISNSLKPHFCTADIHEHIFGSDHCPISLEMEF